MNKQDLLRELYEHRVATINHHGHDPDNFHGRIRACPILGNYYGDYWGDISKFNLYNIRPDGFEKEGMEISIRITITELKKEIIK